MQGSKVTKWSRFKQGLKDLTPYQLTKSKLIGHAGTIFGTIFGWSFLIAGGMWYFSILLVFIVFLQVISFIETKKQYDQLKQFYTKDGKEK